MRKFAVGVHRYLGLALGSLLLISGITGSAIVFNKAIDARLNTELLRVVPQAHRASLDDILSKAHQAIPNEKASFLFLPEARDLAMEIWFRNSGMRAYANPYTGEVLGVRDGRDSMMGFLVDLHIHLLSGETGEKIMGWSGLGAVVLSLLGLYLWWPKRSRWKQAFSIKWQAASIRVWLDIHKIAGVITFAFLLITAVTGSALALHDIITERALIALTGEGTRKPAPKSKMAEGRGASLSAMVDQAKSVFPSGQVTRVSLPATPQAAVMIRMRLPGEVHQFGRTFVWFDQHDGTILRVDNALEANLATRIQSWLYPLHTGVYGGLPTRWLQVLVGLSLSLLTLSGGWVWWKGYSARRAVIKQRQYRAA